MISHLWFLGRSIRKFINNLIISAGHTLEYINLSSNQIEDDTLKLIVKCRNLHTLICSEVTQLTRSALAKYYVKAPIRKLVIAECPDITREGLQNILDLSSITHLIIDDFPGMHDMLLSDFI